MLDVGVLAICVVLVFGTLGYARLWLSSVGDIFWMFGLRPRTVLATASGVGLVVDLVSLVLLPRAGLGATRFALILLVLPVMTRWLSDRLVWQGLPKAFRPKVTRGAIFDQAEAEQQTAFIRALADVDPGAPRDA